MPLARLMQYRHCLLRKYDQRTRWSNEDAAVTATASEQLAQLRAQWLARRAVDSTTD